MKLVYRITTTAIAAPAAALAMLTGCSTTHTEPPPAPTYSQGTPFDFATYTAAITGTAPAAWQPRDLTDLMLGPVQEDDPRWSCVDDGNRICGPGNANGVPAGCYDDGGVLVAPWPCHVVVNPDGSGDVFTGPDPATIDVPELNGTPHQGTGAQPGPH